MASQHDPWKSESVLTLDGGGIRGYASLRIVEALMDAIAKEERARDPPHESSFWPLSASPTIRNSQEANQVLPDAESSTPDRSQSAQDAIQDTPNDAHDVEQAANPPNGEPLHNMGPSVVPLDLNAEPSVRPELLHVETGNTLKSDDSHVRDKMLTGYLPFHYFDLIAGTSTGGLNAIMLSRLRMSVEECLKEYPWIAQQTFGRKKTKIQRIRTGAKYDAAPMVTEIERLVTDRTNPKPPRLGDFKYEMYPSPEDLCKTVVISKAAGTEPFLFRTYNNSNPGSKNHSDAANYHIWEVARATSAADLKFDPIIIDDIEFSDGGLGNNNPSPAIFEEVMNRCAPRTPISNAINMFVSIGTGVRTKREKVKRNIMLPALRKHFGIIRAIEKVVERLVTHGTGVDHHHKHMLDLMQYGSQEIAPGIYKNYARFNGGDKVGVLELDEWFLTKKRRLDNMTTQEFIDHHIREYLGQADIVSELKRCATALVDQRRARIAADEHKWRRFAHATLQICPWRPCRPKRFYETKTAVIQHIRQVHSDSKDLQRLIDNILEYAPRLPRGPF